MVAFERADSEADPTDALRWTFLRNALAETTTRFTDMLNAVADASRPAVGDWSIGETAAHVRVVSVLNSVFAVGDDTPAGLEAVRDKAAHATMATVGSEVNRLSLEWETRRDTKTLAPVI